MKKTNLPAVNKIDRHKSFKVDEQSLMELLSFRLALQWSKELWMSHKATTDFEGVRTA